MVRDAVASDPTITRFATASGIFLINSKYEHLMSTAIQLAHEVSSSPITEHGENPAFRLSSENRG